MKAIVISEPGAPEVLQLREVEDPEVKDDEVLIRVHATALNRADTLQRLGSYSPPPGSSPYPGLECSGTIESVGNSVSRWKVGDQVSSCNSFSFVWLLKACYSLCWVCALLSGGGYAEKVAVPVGQILPVPAGISLKDAAAFPEVACTVWSTVFMMGHLSPGESFLVHGGSSGIGTFAIQMAKHQGVRVFVTAGNEEKLAACKELGADVCINYKTEDFVAKKNLDSLNFDGRLCIIGLMGGANAEIKLSSLLPKRLTVLGAALRPRSKENKAVVVAEVEKTVWPAIEAGKVKPVIYKYLPLSQAAEAHSLMESSNHIGISSRLRLSRFESVSTLNPVSNLAKVVQRKPSISIKDRNFGTVFRMDSSLRLWFARVLMLTQLIHGALSWGKEGHYTVCKIAESYFEEETVAAVKKLLPESAEGDLASVCSWPDEIKHHWQWRWTSPLHYVDTPDYRCNYQYCRRLLSVDNLTEALMFLSHYIGDVHQPLHVGFLGDEGGNTIIVRWYRRKTNLHHVWDNMIIESALKTYYNKSLPLMIQALQANLTVRSLTFSMCKYVITKQVTLIICFELLYEYSMAGQMMFRLGNHVNSTKRPVQTRKLLISRDISYASESISLACKYAYRNATPGTTLGDDYFLSRLPIVEKRLAQGGIRLAATLNRIFSSKPELAAT
ncbi:hypothetical protein Bca101_023355 [Brassica carinata]